MPSAAKKSTRRSISRTVRPDTQRRSDSPDWQVQTAKAQFSEVFRRARTDGPQRITRQGKEGVVMISDEEYNRLVVRSRQAQSLVRFFRDSPLVGVRLDLDRDRDAGRDIGL